MAFLNSNKGDDNRRFDHVTSDELMAFYPNYAKRWKSYAKAMQVYKDIGWKYDDRQPARPFERKFDQVKAHGFTKANLSKHVLPALKSYVSNLKRILEYTFVLQTNHRKYYRFYKVLYAPDNATLTDNNQLISNDGVPAVELCHTALGLLSHYCNRTRGVSMLAEVLENAISQYRPAPVNVHVHGLIQTTGRMTRQQYAGLTRLGFHVQPMTYYAHGQTTGRPLVLSSKSSDRQTSYIARNLSYFVRYMYKQGNKLPVSVAIGSYSQAYRQRLYRAIYRSQAHIQIKKQNIQHLAKTASDELADVRAIVHYLHAPSAQNVLARSILNDTTSISPAHAKPVMTGMLEVSADTSERGRGLLLAHKVNLIHQMMIHKSDFDSCYRVNGSKGTARTRQGKYQEAEIYLLNMYNCNSPPLAEAHQQRHNHTKKGHSICNYNRSGVLFAITVG